MIFTDGGYYIGEFKDNMMDGQGKYFDAKGKQVGGDQWVKGRNNEEPSSEPFKNDWFLFIIYTVNNVSLYYKKSKNQ